MFKLRNLISRIMSVEPIRRQSIVSFIWQIGFTLIGFLSTMYFAHAVGAGILGAYFLFLTYFSIVGLLTDGGFGGAAIKRISEGDEPDAFFTAYTVIRLVFTTCVVIALIACRDLFVDLNESGSLVWLVIALIASIFQGAISYGITGMGKVGISSTAGFIDNVSRIIIQIFAVFLGYGVAGLAGGFVSGMIIGSLVQLRFFDLKFARFNRDHIKSLLSFSIWSFLVSGGSLVFTHSDSVMIGYYMENADVGVYRVILQFTSLAAFTTTAIRSTLWPRISRWDRIGETRAIERSLSKALTYSLILAIPIFVGGALLGDRLLHLFYGKEFVNYDTLIFLLLVQIINIFQYFFSTYLSAMDNLKELFKVTLLSAIVNIILNAILIPTIGIQGAALATLISMVLNAILARNVLKKAITVRVELGSILNICKASILMGLVVGIYRSVVPLDTIILVLIPVAIGGVIYGIALLRFDESISSELKKNVQQLGIPWPGWIA